jgi:HPt (histidine-containing phosphotransfer) domain-containing protein
MAELLHEPLSSFTSRADLIDMFDGDTQFVDDLAADFSRACPGMLSDIRTALDAGDAAGVSRAAHTLKGSVGYFEPGEGRAMVEGIERIQPTDMARVPELLNALELRLGTLQRYLAQAFYQERVF